MIVVAAALLLVAVGLLAGGLAQGSSLLEWSSFGASALAALVLAAGELRQRRRGRAPAAPAASGAARQPVAATVNTPPGEAPPAGPGRPAALAVPAEPVLPVPPPAQVRPPLVPGPQTGRHGVPDPEPDVQPLPTTPPVPPPATGARPAFPPNGGGPGGGGPNGGGPVGGAPAGAPADVPAAVGEPPAEEVEFTDLLMIMDLTDEVLVVDEHPRYHLTGCPHVAGVPTIPIPLDQARADGFTPCGTCTPDRTLAARERARRTS